MPRGCAFRGASVWPQSGRAQVDSRTQDWPGTLLRAPQFRESPLAAPRVGSCGWAGPGDNDRGLQELGDQFAREGWGLSF